MELRQLRYFVAVAEESHFGRAAQRLHMSQPPLSMQIKGLEAELGVELLNRSTRQVALTDAGRAFLEKARAILGAVEEAQGAARGAEHGTQGQLHVGFISSATLSLLPPSIRLFRERFGGVELELKELTSAQQVDALYEDEIKVGLVRLPMRAPGIQFEPVLEELDPIPVALLSLLLAEPDYNQVLLGGDVDVLPVVTARREVVLTVGCVYPPEVLVVQRGVSDAGVLP
jgi:DNA-binding transcriptional LysR family regulator